MGKQSEGFGKYSKRTFEFPETAQEPLLEPRPPGQGQGVDIDVARGGLFGDFRGGVAGHAVDVGVWVVSYKEVGEVGGDPTRVLVVRFARCESREVPTVREVTSFDIGSRRAWSSVARQGKKVNRRDFVTAT